MVTLHVRTGCDQLAISGEGNTLVYRIARKGGVGRDELICHEALHQTALAVCEPIHVRLIERHAESGFHWQVGWVKP